MAHQLDPDRKIDGSYIFTGAMSQNGYQLNKLGYSLMSDEARAELKMDEESYMSRFELSEAHKQLIRDRDWLGCVKAGANIYFLYKRKQEDNFHRRKCWSLMRKVWKSNQVCQSV